MSRAQVTPNSSLSELGTLYFIVICHGLGLLSDTARAAGSNLSKLHTIAGLGWFTREKKEHAVEPLALRQVFAAYMGVLWIATFVVHWVKMILWDMTNHDCAPKNTRVKYSTILDTSE